MAVAIAINLYIMAQNLCLWYDGSLRPSKGHNATLCKWQFDGQFFYHIKEEEL